MRRRRPLGTPLELINKGTLERMKQQMVCKQVKYKIKGVIKKLEYQDIVMLRDGQIGPITKLFKDGHFCFGQTKKLFKLNEIHLNLTVVSPEEQKLLDRNRFWYEGHSIEVFSHSAGVWFPGKIRKIFHIKDKDPLTVHPEKWYQLEYHTGQKMRYKQLIWYSVDIRSSNGTGIAGDDFGMNTLSSSTPRSHITHDVNDSGSSNSESHLCHHRQNFSHSSHSDMSRSSARSSLPSSLCNSLCE